MGICTSFDRTMAAATAKLVHEDGRLSEFESPIKVSEILQSNTNNFFICDADELAWDELISAIDDEDELQLGNLYLELPSSRLNRPITPEEMAALAVKSSLALQNVANGRCCNWFPMRNVSFFDYFKSNKSNDEEVSGEDTTPLVQIGGGIVRRKQGGGIGGHRGGGGGGRRQKKFISQLSVILEGQEISDIPN